jgi:hypothetical protein
MKVKEYTVLMDCVERGITMGISRSHKYNDNPSDEEIKSVLVNAVMLEICEYFDFKAVDEWV